jgi:hypothetical protein
VRYLIKHRDFTFSFLSYLWYCLILECSHLCCFEIVDCTMFVLSSSNGTTTLVGFGLLNCHWTFSAGRFYRVSLPAARQTPNLEENEGFRALQRSPQEAPSVWSNVSEPSSGRWNYGRENGREILPNVMTSTSLLGSFICHKGRHGTDGFTSSPKEGVLRIFSPEKSDSFGWVWTRELGYQRPARYL